MKRLLILSSLLITLSTYGQMIGENWTNVPENLTAEVIALVNEKVPAGETYVGVFRNDKYAESGIDKAPDAEINNVIALHLSLQAAGKRLALVYTFDTRGRCSVTDAYYAFDKFVEAGIYIPACRGGNEEYAKKSGHLNFAAYQAYIEPLIGGLEYRGFTGKFIIPLARWDEVDKLGAWNSDAAEFCATSPMYEGDIHFYWNEELAPALGRLQVDAKGERYLPTVTVTAGSYSEFHDTFYKDLYNEVTTSPYIANTMNWYEANFPGKQAWITEFGPAVGVGPIGNTLGYAATVDYFLNEIENYNVAAVCQFNGPGSLTGGENKKSTKDLTTLAGTYVKRTHHYTLAQYWANRDAIKPKQITEPGSYTFSVHHMVRGEEGIEINLATGLQVTEKYYEYISGTNYYSSSGVCAWWATGSDKTYEIDGRYVTNSIHSLSFGYVHVTVENAVYGCIDPSAENYNSDANADDGSCYYWNDCGCKDRTASNYDADAPCENNLICEYNECLRKRWLFSGCKTAKTNCNCN